MIFFSLTVILVYAFIRGHDNKSKYGSFIAPKDDGLDPKPLINTKTFVTFIGTAVFAFEGIGITCPVMDETKNKKNYPIVTGIALTLISILYFTFGLINYLVYKDSDLVAAPLITNLLNERNIFIDIMVILYVVVIIITYILNIYPAI